MQAGAEVAPALGRKNGFLVFGERPGERALIRCGVYELQKRIAISQGSGKQAPPADRRIEIVPGERRKLAVIVDLDAGEITSRVGSEMVSLPLRQPSKCIAYVGYAVQGAATDFSPIAASKE